MAKVGQIQAKAIYSMLKTTIDTCIKENNWEFYKTKTLTIAKNIKESYGVPTLAHLTCVSSTKRTVAERIRDIKGQTGCWRSS